MQGGQPLGGELSDLELLRGKAIAEIRRTPPYPLPSGTQLLSSSAAPGCRAQRIEEGHALPQRRPRFGPAPLPSQPAPERKQCPGSNTRIASQVLSERRGGQGLRLIVRGQEW